MTTSISGSVARRVEDRRSPTGASRYVDDLRVEGALRACLVRSIIAHGRLLGIVGTVLALGCLVAGCSKVNRVTEPLTSSPSVPAASSGPATTAVVDPAISIETPLEGGEVGTPVSVTGSADVVGAALTVRVLGEDCYELAAIAIEASCGDGCMGTFATELSFFVERRQPATIEVSGVGGDGDPALASVPVVLFPP